MPEGMVQAVAFANLSRRGYAAHLRNIPTQRYAEAVRSLRAALNDPKQLSKDQTLDSCHLLALYGVSLDSLRTI